MKVKPLGNNVLVDCIVPRDKTDGGILIPNVAKASPTEGIIKAVGPGEQLENKKVFPMPVKVGDKVLISFSGQEVDGKPNLRLINIEDILAIQDPNF